MSNNTASSTSKATTVETMLALQSPGITITKEKDSVKSVVNPGPTQSVYNPERPYTSLLALNSSFILPIKQSSRTTSLDVEPSIAGSYERLEQLDASEQSNDNGGKSEKRGGMAAAVSSVQCEVTFGLEVAP